MKRLSILVSAVTVALAACATGAPYRVEGTANGCAVNWAASARGVGGAQAAADAHCARYSRRAVLVGKLNDFTVGYSCTE